ncbi:MAG: extracellular solute-binding protein [Treponema sp.]|nr:extracellular solute-binding protein [Treponema sp.]
MKKALFSTVTGIVLAAVIVLAACNKEEANASDPNYPVNISIFHETGGHPQPGAGNPIYRYLEDKLNVSFSWDILVGDAKQKQGVMIASGDYPDILELRGTEWIDAGALIPLEDLIEQYGPRILAHYHNVWESMRSADGHIYYLINFGVFHGIDHEPDFNQNAFWIQKAVLKEAGYPETVTMDQFFDLISDYYRKNPTINGRPTIPFTILTHDWRIFELWNPPNFLAGYPNDGGIVDPSTYTFSTFFTKDISKRWFKRLNQLNADGLLDRTSFTDNYDQYLAKIAAGRVLGQFVQGWQFMYSADLANRDRGENIRTMAPLPIVFDEGIQPWYRNVTIPNLYRGMGISVSAKDPVRIIRFINDLLDEEVQRTLYWGIENEHWQWNSEGVPYRSEEQRANWQNDNWQEQNRARLMDDIFPKIQGSFSDGYPHDLTQFFPEREATLSPEDIELFEAYGVTSTNELMDKNPRPNPPWFPVWTLPGPPDGSAAQIAQARFEQTMRQRLPQIILASPSDFDRLWDAYAAEMDSNGIADFESFRQEQINQRLIDWGIRK